MIINTKAALGQLNIWGLKKSTILMAIYVQSMAADLLHISGLHLSLGLR
jgi:hypothetical protein